MINAKYIRIIFGIIGNVLSTLISLPHILSFIQIYKKKSVEGVEPTRHFMMLIQCSLWVLYGLPLVHKDSILVSTSNGVVLLIEVIYVVIFYANINCEDISRVITPVSLIVEFTFVGLFYFIIISGTRTLSARHTVVGVVCNVFNIGINFCTFPINKMPAETKTFKYMPFWLSLVGFINAGVWIAYSLIYIFDIYVLISSGIETLLHAFQLIVYACPVVSIF